MVVVTMHCTLTRALTFHARHRYVRAAWSEAENRRRFGKNTEAPGHGHLYRVEVTVGGPLQQETSVIIDLSVFDSLLAEIITGPLSGNLLNEIIPEFASGTTQPTCEALAAWCWRQLTERLLPPVHVERVRVAEDETLWAECLAQPM
jgi:6-pyruvoyltetrahydropterin/6-carboxytetrahydropterin synthase